MWFQLTVILFAVCSDAVLNCPKLCSWCSCVHGAQVFTSRSGGQYEAFLGIPYAVKPVGPLRLKNPKKNIILPSVLTGEKHKCIQRNLFLWRLQSAGSEDCLYLNVFRPRTSGVNLPVLVYLPHSNFLYGSGLSRDIAPDIIMENKHIVLVVIQYRIGLLGFFSTGDRHAPGNLGFKDQQLGLDWVKDMIRFFSGNKDDITVFGDASVMYQLMQPSIVFHKAIISGNYAFNYYEGAGAMKASVAAKAARIFSWTLYDKVLPNKELVEKLQEEPIDKLMSVQGLIHSQFFYPFHNFGPIIDEDIVVETTSVLVNPIKNYANFLLESPTELWKKMQHNVSILLGYGELYGEQNVDVIQNVTQFAVRMSTREALKYHLNLPDERSVSKVLKRYYLKDQPVFNITPGERETYVRILSERSYLQSLFKTIKLYNDYHPNDKRLFLYILNESAKYNNAEAVNMFHSFQKGLDSSAIIVSIFQEFMKNGRGPTDPCIFDNKVLNSNGCKYIEIEKSADGINETVIHTQLDYEVYAYWRHLFKLPVEEVCPGCIYVLV